MTHHQQVFLVIPLQILMKSQGWSACLWNLAWCTFAFGAQTVCFRKEKSQYQDEPLGGGGIGSDVLGACIRSSFPCTIVGPNSVPIIARSLRETVSCHLPEYWTHAYWRFASVCSTSSTSVSAAWLQFAKAMIGAKYPYSFAAGRRRTLYRVTLVAMDRRVLMAYASERRLSQ